MKRIRILLVAMIIGVELLAQKPISIIPKPVFVQQHTGIFEIDEKTSVHFDTDQLELKDAVSFFKQAIKSISGYELAENGDSKSIIQLILDTQSGIYPEGYNLVVEDNLITLKAGDKAGLVYGIQSLLQILPPVRTNAALEIPCMTIDDYPRFKWRGMHLDVSRHFFGPEVIKEYIDLMASYKLNVFHWHLVDDTGWRIEIKKYPKLTSVGAWRVDYNHIPWSQRPQAKPGETPDYGGYYTQEQIKEIVEYAALRNITIVPEIEMPGHIASAIAAYPELSCNQKAQLPLTGGDYTGISSNYCAGNDSVFDFLENILTEVIDLFPSTYIHIGGDEVNKTSWEKCERCQKRIHDEGLKDEHELQSYFIKRIEKFLLCKNRKLIGWDEILEGGLAPQATVMSWRGESGGVEAAKMGHDVVMTPGKPCYFDHYQAGPAGEPLAIGGFNTLKTVYDYEPIPAALPTESKQHVLGAQANVWTEYIPTVSHLEYMVLPRMAALAEVVWLPAENKDWIDFNKRIQQHFKTYEQKGLNYCAGNATVAIKPVSSNGSLQVELSTELPGAEIYYTIDGSEPDNKSLKYSEPVNIISSAYLKAVSVVNGKVMGQEAASQHFVVHQAVGRNVDYLNPVSRYYQADGPNSLTDGVRGTGNVGKYWHGIVGKDLVATIDLGEVKDVGSIALGCLQKYVDWIFMPEKVVFETSVNGRKYKQVGEVLNPLAPGEAEKIYDFKVSIEALKARFIRVRAVCTVCPEGHNGAGKPAWIFADEIIVE